ncbi:MAG TPA: HEPN domain-containing protein [Thermoanaerobaculia bacterium]|nr:HEPN domain-containing protein [Thermoanaerobaculia bacterium]
MATRNQLKDLALLRRHEAQVLFDAQLYDGARYLAGYVLELALKARICRILDFQEYPDSGEFRRLYATHDLDLLLKLSGLSRKPSLQEKALFDSWSTAALWKPERRYDVPGTAKREDVRDILAAVEEVLRWIKRHW